VSLEKYSGFGLCVALFGWASVSFADSIIITDCLGTTRAVEEVTTGSERTVSLSIEDTKGMPADAVQVILSNSGTGQHLTEVAAEGRVSFTKVGAGTWAACVTGGGFRYSGARLLLV
jgi:hypothetical protein